MSGFNIKQGLAGVFAAVVIVGGVACGAAAQVPGISLPEVGQPAAPGLRPPVEVAPGRPAPVAPPVVQQPPKPVQVQALQTPLPFWQLQQMATQDQDAFINKLQADTRVWLVGNRPDLVSTFDTITSSQMNPKTHKMDGPQWAAEMAGHFITAQNDRSQANSVIQDWAVSTDRNLLKGPNLRPLSNQDIASLSKYLSDQSRNFVKTCALEPEIGLDKSGHLTAPANCEYKDLGLNIRPPGPV